MAIAMVCLLLTCSFVLAQQSDQLFDYRTPVIENHDFYLYEHFDNPTSFDSNWIKSLETKSDSDNLKYDGEWALVDSNSRLKDDSALELQSKARHHAISSKLKSKFEFKNKPLVVQYEVQFRNGQECGGAYIKLLTSPTKHLNKVNDATPYTIMFGPDKCGNDHKLHFIFKHKHPKNGTIRELHFNKASMINKLEEIFKDKKWHIFRLTLRPDNTFEIQVDKKIVHKGDLLEDFTPSVNPPKEIEDKTDKKPEDWDDREKIADPDARKPVDWDENQPRKIIDPNAQKPYDWLEDESEMIPDSKATKPDDWDTDLDGEWEAPLVNNPKCAQVSGCGKWKAPLIDNPKYKGKWKPALISNPNYKGKWSPRKIKNPEYFHDAFPFKMAPIDAVAFELWSISDKIAFDNILITDDIEVANYIMDHTYQIKKELADAETDNWFFKLIKDTNKKPWLWVIYTLVIAVPVILFIGFCCVTPGKHKHTQSYKPDKNETIKENIIEESNIEEIQEEEEEEEEEEEDDDVEEEKIEETDNVENETETTVVEEPKPRLRRKGVKRDD